MLNGPITVGEIIEAIKNSKSGKTPMPNRLPDCNVLQIF